MNPPAKLVMPPFCTSMSSSVKIDPAFWMLSSM